MFCTDLRAVEGAAIFTGSGGYEEDGREENFSWHEKTGGGDVSAAIKKWPALYAFLHELGNFVGN